MSTYGWHRRPVKLYYSNYRPCPGQPHVNNRSRCAASPHRFIATDNARARLSWLRRRAFCGHGMALMKATARRALAPPALKYHRDCNASANIILIVVDAALAWRGVIVRRPARVLGASARSVPAAQNRYNAGRRRAARVNVNITVHPRQCLSCREACHAAISVPATAPDSLRNI